MLIVITYDIADDRRRNRLRKLLLGYGQAVQESVVECDVSPAQLRELRERVTQTIQRDDDQVAYYPLCQSCAGKVRDGRGQLRAPAPAVLVV
jgi:CRISPR-associated protein Cas2